MDLQVPPERLSKAWWLLRKTGPLKISTISALFCDHFNIVPTLSRDLITALIRNGHATNDTGWITLREPNGKEAL